MRLETAHFAPHTSCMKQFLSLILLVAALGWPVHAQSGPSDAQSGSGGADALPPLEEQSLTAGDPLSQAMQDVRGYMKTVDSLRARFRQVAPDGSVMTGVLYLKRPGRVRFDYDDDTPFLVVADGEVLSFVDYEVGQVQRWPVQDTPLRLLLGRSLPLDKVTARVDLSPGGRDGAPDGQNDMIALHAQDPDKPEMGRIALYFERLSDAADRSLRLVGWNVVDGQGKTTRVRLSDHRRNPTLAAALWSFDDPRGLDKRRRSRR
ncbi:LolA family protein [Yunchengibacter salinarum]|uniref:LolA family protein n=1 Tax=Yunchengibacter salinarum TaxID=3133399 RepID=UPI0035B5A253